MKTKPTYIHKIARRRSLRVIPVLETMKDCVFIQYELKFKLFKSITRHGTSDFNFFFLHWKKNISNILLSYLCFLFFAKLEQNQIFIFEALFARWPLRLVKDIFFNNTAHNNRRGSAQSHPSVSFSYSSETDGCIRLSSICWNYLCSLTLEDAAEKKTTQNPMLRVHLIFFCDMLAFHSSAFLWLVHQSL